MFGITKEFPGVLALEKVTLEIFEGEIHSIVGENGAGKSTLIKILGGVYPAQSYTGKIIFLEKEMQFRTIRDSEKAGIAVIHQELNLVPYLTITENIFLGNELVKYGILDRHSMINEAQKLLDQLGLNVSAETEVYKLGIGQQQLVEIVKALYKKSKVLILDEPTAALSVTESELLFKILKNLKEQGNSIVFISHKLDEVLNISDRISVLRDGKNAGSDIVKNWDRQKLVQALVGRDLTEMFPYLSVKHGGKILEIENLSVENPAIKGKNLLTDISFFVNEGEVLGVSGLMGAGRTELLLTIFGNPPGLVLSGNIKIDGKEIVIDSPLDAIKYGLALVPEDRKSLGLVLGMSIIENISLVHLENFTKLGTIDNQAEEVNCSSIAGQLNIKSSSMYSAAESLSGGNQQKIVLGKWLLKEPKVFFLDEPTRGIDIGAKVEIYKIINQLKEKGLAIVVVSSELPELIGICDRIIILRSGRITGNISRDEFTQEKIAELSV